jgi:hypothetical protein
MIEKKKSLNIKVEWIRRTQCRGTGRQWRRTWSATQDAGWKEGLECVHCSYILWQALVLLEGEEEPQLQVPVQFEGGVPVTSQCLEELLGLGELFKIFYFFRYYDTSILGIPARKEQVEQKLQQRNQMMEVFVEATCQV